MNSRIDPLTLQTVTLTDADYQNPIPPVHPASADKCGQRFQTDVAMNFACGKHKGHEDHGDPEHGWIDQQVLSDARDVTAGRKIAVVAGETTSASLIEKARAATTELRDAARTGTVIGYLKRDPLVMAIHNALDALERLAAPSETERNKR